jgi:glycosyltransferase involved in cell wall biosynthesis
MKKRVLFFSHYPTRFGLDGANKILMLTASEMPELKYEKLVLLQSHGAVSDYLDQQGINYKIMDYDCEQFNALIYGDNDKSDFDGICRAMEEAVEESELYQFVKEWKPDIMYVNSCMAIIGAICGKLAGAKVLWHIHDITTGILGEADHNNLNRVIAKYADKIVTVSRAVKDALHETGELDKTELVYIGVQNPGYSEQELCRMNLSIRQNLGVQGKTPIIAYLGQISPLKGIDRFIHTAHFLLKKEPEAKFIIIGDYNRNAEYTFMLRDLIQSLKLNHSVRFVGYYQDLSAILPAIDCLVVPSAYEEPFGAITVEANLYRKPVVAFDRGGIKEGVIHGRNGFLVEKDNVRHMAAAVYTIIHEPDKAGELGRFGYNRAVSKFSYQRYLNNTEEILEETGKGIFGCNPVRNGNIVRSRDGGMYLIKGGYRYAVNGLEELYSLGLDEQDLLDVSKEVLDAVPLPSADKCDHVPKKKKYRILFFIPYRTDKGIDGASKILSMAANGLSNEFFEKWLVSPDQGEISRFLDKENIQHKIIEDDCFKAMDMIYQRSSEVSLVTVLHELEEYLLNTPAFQFIAELQPDIVYVNTTMAINGAIMGKLAGAKVLWHVHDIGESFLSGENCRDLNRIIYRYADKIVGVGKAVQRSIGIAGKFHKFEVVYNGVKPPVISNQELEEARVQIRRKLDIGEEAPVIAYLGQFQRFKGLHHFVACAALIRKKIKNARFLIIGDPDKDPVYAQELKDQIKSAGMESMIRFAGYYRNLNDILPALDCLVVPSVFEDPLPTVVIEGNLYKIPVAAFDRGGIGEILLDGKNGYLVEKDNIEQLADAVVNICRNPAIRMEMAEFGHQRSLNKFGHQRFIDNMEEILLEVAEGNTNGKPVRNGNLIRGSGSEIYWLVDGKKHLVESDAALQSLGFGLEDIQSVKDEVLTQIPGGNTGGLL